MPHPLDEVRNTPWGQQMERRMGVLEVAHAEHERKFLRLGDKLDRIDKNTEWLVDIFRGSRALGPLLIGIGSLLIAAAAVATWLGWVHK